MGRTPRSPQSHKHDTLGVGFDPNCPDRSWWVAHVGQHKTKRRHRSGKRGSSPHAKRDTGTERKKRRASNKDKPRALDREKTGSTPESLHSTAAARDFASLRCAPRGQRFTERKNLTDV